MGDEKKLTFNDLFFAELADRGPDHTRAPKVFAFVTGFELFDFVGHVLEHVEPVFVPGLFAEAAVWRVECGAHVDVVDTVVE